MEEYIVPLKPKKCCVPNCLNRSSKRHRFPKSDIDLFKTWLQIIKPVDCDELTIEQIYNRSYVCEAHFSSECFVPGTRRGLTRNAVPTLLIPAYSGSKDISGEVLSINISTTTSSTSTEMLTPSTAIESSVYVSEAEMAGPSTRSPTPGPLSFTEIPALSKEEHRRRPILSQVNTTRSTYLTPKAKHFYQTLKNWSKKMSVMSKNIKSYRERLATVEKVQNSRDFQNLLQYVNEPTYHVMMCQVRNQQLKLRARRYTLEEKILALSLFKSSGKGYRLLSKIFALPSSRTLTTLLQQIPFYPGINKQIFDSLKLSVENMKNVQEKVCVLLFDEIALQSNVTYQRKHDAITGIEDYGNGKRAVLADHANVYMLKGVYRQWKQPIAFTFSHGPVKSNKLKDMTKIIIRQCQSIGLDVIATVCDQGSTNQTAINLLLKETKEQCIRDNIENKHFGFLVDGREIIPLYDVPHLFKGLRNNLLNKNLHFTMDGQNKTGKWSHIDQFYKLDSSEPALRICNKLTDAHILPSKMNKMKVKNCTQVFSHAVGSLMKRIAQWDIKDNYNLPKEATDTADLILFLDKLFDSLNISKKSKPQAKPLKWAVTKNSIHEEFWQNSLKILDTMKFFSLEKQRFVAIPTLKNLKFTVKGFVYLRQILLIKKKFKFVLTGAFNQDPLENFFSYIRSHGHRYTNPDVAHFCSSFKSLVVNNFMSSHSPGSNCQKDMATECLDNLRTFLTGEYIAGVRPLDTDKDLPEIPRNIIIHKETKIARCTLVYMGGAIIKILLKTKMLKECENCQNNLSVRHDMPMEDDFIEAREYERAHLMKPGHYVNFLVTHSMKSLFYLIPRLVTTNKIANVLNHILQQNLNFNVLNSCPQHNLGLKLCEVMVRCALFWWCKQVNKIVNGSDTKFAKFLSTNPGKDYIDPVKLHALEKFRTYNKRHRSK